MKYVNPAIIQNRSNSPAAPLTPLQHLPAAATGLASGGRRIDDLLARMRSGDREAAAEFITSYASRVRRRIRGKLGSDMRRLFDSQEILSTIGRRLDIYVRDGRLRAAGEGQLWSFIYTMANNALIQKARVFERLKSVEGSDGRFAQELLARLEQAEQDRASSAELEMDKVLQSLEEPVDREVLAMWLLGRNHGQIAEEMGIGHDSIRKRWQRIREKLRRMVDAGVL